MKFIFVYFDDFNLNNFWINKDFDLLEKKILFIIDIEFINNIKLI